MRELKNLQGCSLSNVGCALKDTFDLLNMHRLQSGFDNYGMVRFQLIQLFFYYIVLFHANVIYIWSRTYRLSNHDFVPPYGK